MGADAGSHRGLRRKVEALLALLWTEDPDANAQYKRIRVGLRERTAALRSPPDYGTYWTANGGE